MKKNKLMKLNYKLLAILSAGVVAGIVTGCNGSGGSSGSSSDTGQNWSIVGESGFASSSADIARIKVGNSGNTVIPYVAYTLPKSDSTFPGYVKKFNGSSWEFVGAAFAANVTSSALAVDNVNGTLIPYVAYQDLNNNGKLAVKRFDGASWVTVGDPTAVAGEIMGVGQATSININFDRRGRLLVAYEWYPLGSSNPMAPDGGHPSVISYDPQTNIWRTIGGELSEGTANAAAGYLAMKIAPDNIATLAYSNIGNRSNALYIQQLDLNVESATWGLVGTNFNPSPFVAIDVAEKNKVLAIYADLDTFGGASSLYTGGGNLVSLAPFSNGYIGTTPSTVLGADETPYVVFQGEKQKGVLKSYDANRNVWSVMASSPDEVANPQLTRDAAGNIYVLYSEPEKGGQLTVMKYTPNN